MLTSWKCLKQFIAVDRKILPLEAGIHIIILHFHKVFFFFLAFRNNQNIFVHCDLTNVKVNLNSDLYPYDDLNRKFDRNRFAVLYAIFFNVAGLTITHPHPTT